MDDVDFEVLDTPIKSENDTKSYRVIKLRNGLIATLISDCAVDDEGMDKSSQNDSVKSAASLSINVGTFANPKQYPGLAHFLEHMMSMGSEKYPGENEYSAFISKNGGDENASTEREVTTFWFSIDRAHFREGLDMFANMFIAPLLTKSAIQREREAVESEFNQAKLSDETRKRQLLLSLAKEGHPARNFAYGNVDTLAGNAGILQAERDDEIFDYLHEFRRKYYVANAMRLALQSSHDLDTLQQWVMECFSSIRAGDEPSLGQIDLAPFDTSEFYKFYQVSPVSDKCVLNLTWALPSVQQLYESKPDEYIAAILGSEDYGSLSKYLRDKIWIIELLAGASYTSAARNSIYLLFSLEIKLTEQGLENLSNVIEAVFSYLQLIRDTKPQEWLYEEKKIQSETTFKFSEQSKAEDNVEVLSDYMIVYPPKHYLINQHLISKFDPEFITNMLNRLTPKKLNIILQHKKSSEIFDKTEYWFNTPYNCKEIPADWIEKWSNVKPFPEFKFIKPNKYLSTDFSLVPIENETEYPEKVRCDELCELWYKQDAKFRLPKAYIFLYLHSSLASTSPINSASMKLIKDLLNHFMLEEYAAEEAQLHYSISTATSGMILKFHGFNHKLPMLLDTVIDHIMNFEHRLTENVFDAIKGNHKKQYSNESLDPSNLANYLRDSMLLDNYWTSSDRYAAIDDVTFESLLSFMRALRSRLYVNALIQGNVTKENAMNIMEKIVTTLNYQPVLPNSLIQGRIGQVEVGARTCRVATLNNESSNSCVEMHFFCGLTNLKEKCTLDMFMSLANESAFNILRTQEQLAYVVSATRTILRGVQIFSITIRNQESKHSVGHVESRIWEFLRFFGKKLEELSDADVEGLRQTAMKDRLRPVQRLDQDVLQNWLQIQLNQYYFDYKTDEYEELAKISKNDMLCWYRKYILGLDTTTRQLCVQVQGFVPTDELLFVPMAESEDAQPQINADENDKSENEMPKKEEVKDDVELKKPDYELCPRPAGLTVLKAEDSVGEAIIDISAYKKSLFLYPVHKRTKKSTI